MTWIKGIKSDNILCLFLVALMSFSFTAVVLGQETSGEYERVTWWKNGKIRILIDKVYSRNKDKLIYEEDFADIKKAGFNVVGFKWHAFDLDIVSTYAKHAQKNGLYLMPFMRGIKKAEEGGTRLISERGLVCGVESPHSDILWKYLNKRVLDYAKLSQKHPNIIGVLLDFELYIKPKPTNAYPLSYDEKILKEFGDSRKIIIPALEPAERRNWLEKKNLLKEFEIFQENSFKNRCRKLRKAVDEINPYFQFIVYQAEYLINKIALPEWSTSKAPVIIADAGSYGKVSELISQAENLKANQNRLLDHIAGFRASNLSQSFKFLYVGGIDPILFTRLKQPLLREAGPEFSGKNAVAISEVTDGYWVFFEGPRRYTQEHKEYMKWFSFANEDIKKGRFGLHREPKLDVESLVISYPKKKTELIQVGIYGARPRFKQFFAETKEFEAHPLGGLTLSYLRQFDIVVLQNFNVSLIRGSRIHKILDEYVRKGGGLFLTHDTGWYFESPFPEIAVRGYPKQKVSHFLHVLDTRMIVKNPANILKNLKEGERFYAGFLDHMIFAPGPDGKVLIVNHFEEPVYVAGQVGKGRVVFSGCYFGYRDPIMGKEKDVLLSIVRWLSKKS